METKTHVTLAEEVLGNFQKEIAQNRAYGITFAVEGDVILATLSDDVIRKGGPRKMSCLIVPGSGLDEGLKSLRGVYERIKLIANQNILSRVDESDPGHLK